jgi:hypothetical protein
MTIDAVLNLPGNVRFQDVKEVFSQLYRSDGFSRIHYVPGSDFTCGQLFVSTASEYDDQSSALHVEPGVDVRLLEVHEKKSAFTASCDRYFWSFEGENGTRRMHRVSNPWSIAVLKALADFFGGTVDFDDSDSSFADHVVEPKSNELNCPTDGAPWQSLMERIAAVKPLDKGALR